MQIGANCQSCRYQFKEFGARGYHLQFYRSRKAKESTIYKDGEDSARQKLADWVQSQWPCDSDTVFCSDRSSELDPRKPGSGITFNELPPDEFQDPFVTLTIQSSEPKRVCFMGPPRKMIISMSQTASNRLLRSTRTPPLLAL